MHYEPIIIKSFLHHPRLGWFAFHWNQKHESVKVEFTTWMTRDSWIVRWCQSDYDSAENFTEFVRNMPRAVLKDDARRIWNGLVEDGWKASDGKSGAMAENDDEQVCSQSYEIDP